MFYPGQGSSAVLPSEALSVLTVFVPDFLNFALQALLFLLDVRNVRFLSNRYARVHQKPSHKVYGHSARDQLRCKGVAEAVHGSFRNTGALETRVNLFSQSIGCRVEL